VSDEALEQAKADIHDVFEEVREALAEALGCDPDYRSDRSALTAESRRGTSPV
jgi:hypothetical protein